MNKAPAFQLYAADFYVDTSGWTTAEVGTYFRLLLAEWVNGPLPNNMSELARIAGISDTRTMVKIWNRNVGKKFLMNGGNLLYNKRLEEERENQAKRREIQAEKGLSGAKKRWKDHIATAMPRVIPNDSSSSSSSSSIIKKRNNNISNEDFLLEIKKIYYWVDVDKELLKMDAYKLTHPKWNKSRRSITSWLNRQRSDQPVGGSMPTDKIDKKLFEIKKAREMENGYLETT